MKKKIIILLMIFMFLGISFRMPVYADNYVTDPVTGYIVESTNHNDHWNSVRIRTDERITDDKDETYSVSQVTLDNLNYHINKGDSIYYRLKLRYKEENDGYQEYSFKINNSTKFSDSSLEHGGSKKNTSYSIYYLDNDYHDLNTNASNADGYGYSSSISSIAATFGAHGTSVDDWYINYCDVQFRIVDNVAPSLNVTGFSINEDNTKSNFSSIITTNANEGVVGIKVSDLPDHGTLKYNGTSVNTIINYTDYSKFSYTPNSNYNGSDTIKFRAYDACGNYTEKTMTITVNPVNDAPGVYNTSTGTREDTPRSGILKATDIENDILTFEKVSPPSHGLVTINSNGSYTYVPSSNYNGSDSFTYKVYDGSAYSSIGTFSINVISVNDAPTISDISNQTINEDTTKTVDFNVSDVETSDDSLILWYTSFNETLIPNSGGITFGGSGSNRNLTIYPASNQSGTATITVSAKDSNNAIKSDTFTVIVNPINDPPTVPSSISYSTANIRPTDTRTISWGSSSDVEGSGITYKLEYYNGSSYSLIYSGTNTSYTHTIPNEITNSAKYRVYAYDGTDYSEYKTGNVFTVYSNTKPLIVADSVSTLENQTKDFDVISNDTDANGDTVKLKSINSVSGGIASIIENKIHFIPNNGFTGNATIEYTITDGYDDVNGTLAIKVIALHDVSFNSNGGSAVSSYVDVEDNTKISSPTNPTKEGYTFAGWYKDSLFKNIWNFDVDTVTDDITLYAKWNPKSYTIVFNKNAGTSSVLAMPSNITKSYNSTVTVPGDIPIRSNYAFIGWTTESNGSGTSYTGGNTFIMPLNGLELYAKWNASPVAKNDTSTVNEGGTVNIDVLNNDTDTENKPLTITIVSGPASGTAKVSDNKVQYIHNGNETISDSITYKISDGYSYSSIATVQITINPVNDAPTASNLAINTNENINFSGTFIGSDIDSSTLSYSIVNNPTNGNVNLNENGAYTYKPNDYYSGEDSFTYKVNDGEKDSNIATVSVHIKALSGSIIGGINFNDGASTAIEDGIMTLEQTAVQGNVYLHLQVVDKLANAYNKTYGPIAYDILPPTVEIIPKSADGGRANITVQVADNWKLDTLKYQISDDGGNSFGSLTDYIDDISLDNIDGNNYVIKVVATDWQSNMREVTAAVNSGNLFNDNDAPIVTFGTNGGTAAKSHYTTVNVTDNTGGAGINNNLLKYAFSTDGDKAPIDGYKTFLNGDTLSIDGVTGNYYLWIKAYDYAGNETIVNSNEFILDNTPPSITINASSSAAKSRTITANIEDIHSVTTKYGMGNLDTMYFKNNGNSFKDKFDINQNGVYTIYAADEVGNESIVSYTESKIINTIPTISVNKLENDWTNEDVSISVSAQAAEGAELDKIEYSKDGGTSWIKVNDNTITLCESGEYTLKIKAIDNVGNVSNILETNIYKIDKTLPNVTDTISFSINGNNMPQKSQSAAISTTYVEEEGDIVNLLYNWSTSAAEAPNTWNSFKSGDTVTINNQNGNYYVWAKINVTDKAGNSSEFVKVSSAFVLDNTPIDISIEGNPTEWTNSAEISVTADEATKLKYKAGNFTTANFPADGVTIVDNKFTITENGVYTIFAEDNSGNQSVLTFNAYKLDSSIPTVNLSITSKAYTNEDITVNFIANDEVNGSGIDTVQYQYSSDNGETWTEWINGNAYTFKAEGIYKLKVKTTDNAGNESEIITSGDYKIDKTIPSITEFSAAKVNDNSITLKVTADDTNISNLPYEFSKDNIYETAINNNEYTYSELASNTAYNFKVKVLDTAGNFIESEEKVVYTLASQPTLSIESTKKDMAVIKIIGGHNGIAPMYQVSYTDNNDVFKSLDWSRDTIIALNNIKEGTTINVKARNEDGIENESVTITNVVLDKAPIININSNKDEYVKSGDTITLSGTISDGENGIVIVKSSINGIEKIIDVDTSSTNKWNLSWIVNDDIFDGTYENINIKAKDNAGNESIVVYTGKITVDKLKPNPRLFTNDVEPDVVYNTDKCVKIDTSGIEEGSIVKYSFDNIVWSDYNSSGINITSEGETTVYSKTVDAAGNESDTISLKVCIDKTKPVVTEIYPNPEGNSEHWYNENTTVLMNFDDNWTNGIKTIEYKVTNTVDTPDSYDQSTSNQPVTVYVGQYAYNYIHYKVTDLGGNILTGYFGPYQVDQNQPNDFNINVLTHSIDGFTINASASDDLTEADKIKYYYSINDGEYNIMNPISQKITGLKANTVYSVKVKAADAAGNETISPSKGIRTKALISDDSISVEILNETTDGVKLEITDSANNGDSGVVYKLIVIKENDDLKNSVFEGEYSFDLVKDVSNLEAGTSYDIYVIAKDIQNYETSIKALTFKKSAPPVITINNPDTEASIYKKPGDIIEISGTVSDSDDESLIIAASLDGTEKRIEIDTTDIDTTEAQNFTLSWDINSLNINDGKYTNIEVKAIDSKGSTSSGKYTGGYIVDTLGPNEPTILKSPSREWYNNDVEINITDNEDIGGEPAIGIKSYSYTIGDNEPIEGEGTSIDTITITDEGETSVKANFIDLLGNIGQLAEAAVKIDRVNPVLSNEKNTVFWTNEAINVHITAEDSLSGIDKIYYSVNKNSEVPVDFDRDVIVDANSHTETITINENGAFYIHFKAADKAGNEVVETYGPYEYDEEMPFIDFGMGVYAFTKQSHNFIVNVYDSVSDIRNQLYTWSPERPTDGASWATFNNGDTLTIDNGDGTTKLWVKAEDEAGNILVQSSTDVHLDNTKPTIDLTKSTNDIAAEIDILGKISDDNTGIDVVKWAEGTENIEFFNSNGTELVLPYIFKVNKNEVYTVYAKDKAGNESINTIEVNNVDRYDPLVEVSEDNHDFQNTSYNITLTYKDIEGISKIAYEVTQSEERVENYTDYLETIEGNVTEKAITAAINENGSNYIHYSITDIAGKKITGYFGPYKFDNVKPVLSFEAGNDGTVYTEYITEQTSKYYDTNRDFIGYEVSDNLDTDISSRVVIDDSQIKYDAIGSYNVNFNVTDMAGNTADTLTGNVVVRDTLPPYYLNEINIETDEDEVYIFTQEILTDSDNYIDSSDLKEIIIMDLPSKGILKNKGANVSVSDRITLEDINNGYFTYEPDLNFFGTVAFTMVPVDKYDNVDMEKVNNVNISINSVNDAPTLSIIDTFTGAIEYREYLITYDKLLEASNVNDIENDEISFIITHISSGTLTKNDIPVTEDVTQINQGDDIVWKSNKNENGLLDAFKVAAYDGDKRSSTPVQVKVQVTPRSTNANLAALSISDGTLKPSFNKDIIEYNANVSYQTRYITVVPKAEDSKAAVKVNNQLVNSGNASNNIHLSTGNNTIKVEVTAENEDVTKIYTISIRRASPAYVPPIKEEPEEQEKTEKLTAAVTDGTENNSVSETKIERTTTSGKKKDKVEYEEEKAEETIEKLKEEGKDTARIVIPDPKDQVDETEVKLPKATISVIAKGDINLEIDTENARIILPKESIESLNEEINEDNKDEKKEELYFRVVPIKKDKQRKLVEERAKKEEVVQEKAKDRGISIVGRPMEIETNMKSRKVDIVLPLKDINISEDYNERKEFFDRIAVFIEHSDGEKVLTKGEIVEYKKGVLGVKFTINKFSTFTIIQVNSTDAEQNHNHFNLDTEIKDTRIEDTRITTDLKKTWNVKFNQKINPQSVGEESIEVIDEEGIQHSIETKIQWDEIHINPLENYVVGKNYNLTVGKEISNKKGIESKQKTILPFRVVYGTNEWEIMSEKDLNYTCSVWRIIPFEGADLDTFNKNTIYVTDEQKKEIPIKFKRKDGHVIITLQQKYEKNKYYCIWISSKAELFDKQTNNKKGYKYFFRTTED